VVLIEKSSTAGAAFLEAFRDAGGDAEAGQAFVKSIESHPKARVMLSSTVASLKRTAGNLTLEVTVPGGKKTVDAGAVLIAAGAGRYEPTGYLYGKHASVIDQWDLTARIGAGKIAAKHVVMIQCVGARDSAHPYCSRYCCKQAISNALLYKSNKPEAEITILHKGIRVFGLEEDLYSDAVEKGVRFVKIKAPPEVVEGKPLKVKVTSETDGEISLDADLVVLSLAHAPNPARTELSDVLGAPLDDLGCFASDGSLLLEPFRTPAEGVFVCGFARQPVMAEEAYVDGVGAAQAICRGLMR
jgi:heterodisulfide reductase subunit A